MNVEKINVTVYGARGYTGLESCRLLSGHPYIERLRVVSNSVDWRLSDDVLTCEESKISYISREGFSRIENFENEVVFLACSAQDAFELAPRLMERNARPIDLSGAHRLDKEQTKKFYNLEQGNEFFTQETNYGLVPFGDSKSRFVSNPGCYVSSVLMALIPLLKAGMIDPGNIVIDSKSGTTGAGRAPKDITNLSELVDSVNPYKVGQHQHFPEICRYARYYSGEVITPRFTTTLLPIKRGILSTLYLKTRRGVSNSEIHKAYLGAFGEYPFVKVDFLDGGANDNHKLALRNILNTNYTRIVFHLNNDELTVFSMIDNLMKGAAGQAVENMNMMLGLPVNTGL